jgi:hypothetical protein
VADLPTTDPPPTRREPEVELDARYGEPDAAPTSWADARAAIEAAELWWVATARVGGGPHVTPLIAVWFDGALHIATGAHEQKAVNLAADPRCALTTGNGVLHGGLDLVVEGTATVVRDDARLRQLADAWLAKYGEGWRFTVRDGAFLHEGDEALVFAITPTVAYAFGKEPYSHTRYRWA